MLPSILAKQLQQGIRDYIETTFPMTNEPFAGSIASMFKQGDAVTHDPYIAVQLPFRTAKSRPDYFEGVTLPYTPYVHQEKSFQRLVCEGGKSTLIATGTGSGKTECFMYPVLEYCFQHRHERGIKALIIYPMNALATDQASRFAKEIAASPALTQAGITVGMYVGGSSKGAICMSAPDKEQNILGVITDHDTMINNPPDILLTNYKMLDYLLVRPKDAGLWQYNRPDTLRFIVVDEFHTFDGAQGTDLACLLRRLKSRLYTQQGYLCCVATSATMGGQGNRDAIRSYASQVFGEAFDEKAMITEDRLSPAEFLAGQERVYQTVPDAQAIKTLSALSEADDEAAYLQAAFDAWLPTLSLSAAVEADRIRLGEALKEHSFFQDILELMKGDYWQNEGLFKELRTRYPQIMEWPDRDAGFDSLFSLIAFARAGNMDRLAPFLFVRVQLWMRELRRLLGKVSHHEVTYMLAPDLNEQQKDAYLPVVNCRECGATGWAAILNENQDAVIRKLETFYNLYFQGSNKVVLMYPGYEDHASKELRPAKLCPHCHHLSFHLEGETYCPKDHGELIDVLVATSTQTTGTKKNSMYVCPFCGSRRGLSLMGLRSTTEISASLSQLMASPYNDEKKTLAFSDSVQDAAHRAGFFNSRTWRFGLRSAIQRYVQNGGAGKNLKVFTEGFLAYWQQRLTPEEFVSIFIPPNMTWMKAYQALLEKRVYGKDAGAQEMIQGIRKRLAYEIMLEYGVTSRIGRTLEKANCSCLTFSLEDIKNLADNVQERVINELGVLTSVGVLDFQQMVIGWLTFLRQSGAFDDQVYYNFCKKNVQRYTPFWLTPSSPHHWWLPGLQSGRNTPRFLCSWEGRGKPSIAFESYHSARYTRWIDYCFDDEAFLHEENIPDEISKIILLEALKLDLVHELPLDTAYLHAYGLNKEKLYVSDDVEAFRCDVCGIESDFSENLALIMMGAACTRRHCNGHCQKITDTGLGYYGRLYSEGDLIRVHSREHTGLLSRENRERVENDFKRGKKENRQPWDPNVLSCTPTLEMGIDVGDLSSVILCSMPPGQAQFLQRVGRAGRKSGNSMILVVANARPRDLNFYADPLDMMQGEVAAPHIFLKASAVLERQFIAFCFDNWIRMGVDETAIPKHLGKVLYNVENKVNGAFPFNYLQFAQKNLTSFFQRFISLFANEIDEQTIRELQSFIKGEGLQGTPLQNRIQRSFGEMNQEIEGLNKNIKMLDMLIQEYKNRTDDSSYDEEKEELQHEKQALLNVKREIKRKDLFNFLSDEGLLPNYAFPEEGITLKAVLFRKNDDDTNGRNRPQYENHVYEYQRGASSAISEFAPNNSFYAGGHHFTIDQVDLHSSQPERWRLCPNCAHAELEANVTNRTACPNCGSTDWADIGQVRDMLKVKMVYSNMDMSKSLIDDGNDSREVKFYTRQLLVDVDEDRDIEKAYAMNNSEFPFGYEFVRKAVLREINFGEADISQAEELRVNGEEEVRTGFHVCKYCGRVKQAGGVISHAPYCPTRKNSALLKDSEEACLFLYREFQTEVLRLLIPETTSVGTNVKTQSFTAAFMLGMKEYFGNVDHLRAAVCEVPVRDGDYRKQYLVIYDSVPGGTGYLKQLMQHDDALIHVFEKALDVLENCGCKNDPERDGCYHCLYAYRQNRDVGNVSRKTAIQLVHAVLSGKDNVEEIKKLDNIATNHLFDSELERQFVIALGNCSNEQRQVTIQQALVHDKEGYILNIRTENNGGEAREFSWEIEPQVLLGSEQGVSVKCKPDFVLWPNFADKGNHLPVAVFTDGFLYHKNKVADDTLKRDAIAYSHRFRVWSLSYKDVQSAFEQQDSGYFTNTLDISKEPRRQEIIAKLKASVPGQIDLDPGHLSSLELLIQYLSLSTSETEFQKQAKIYGMALLDPIQSKSQIDFQSWQAQMKPICEDVIFMSSDFHFGNCLISSWQPREEQGAMRCLTGIAIKDMKVPPGEIPTVVAAAVLDDGTEGRVDAYEAEWNGFWRFVNLMQFLPHFTAVSYMGLKDEVYLNLRVMEAETTVPASDHEERSPWDDIIKKLSEWSDEKELAFLRKLQQADIPLPDVIGDELMDGDTVLDLVELGWTTLKKAFILKECQESCENVRKAGWQVFDETTEDVQAIFGGREE